MGSPSMNFIDGQVAPDGFRTADGIVLPLARTDVAATTYGIRPEHLTINDQGVALEVIVIQPTGSKPRLSGASARRR